MSSNRKHQAVKCPGWRGGDGCGHVVEWRDVTAGDGYVCAACGCYPWDQFSDAEKDSGLGPELASKARPKRADRPELPLTIHSAKDVPPRLEATLSAAQTDPRLCRSIVCGPNGQKSNADRDLIVLGALCAAGLRADSVEVIASLGYLVAQTGLNENAVRRSLKRLEDYGYIRRLKRHEISQRRVKASAARTLETGRPPAVFEVCRPPDLTPPSAEVEAEARARVEAIIGRSLRVDDPATNPDANPDVIGA